jgi:hypothetical protein
VKSRTRFLNRYGKMIKPRLPAVVNLGLPNFDKDMLRVLMIG